ncbi:hypothetical protein WME95_17420 [Sorangium sp. So ce327]|uniref:hypothetical protein n=1 Tax=unclassified Sorangium TaxID=2621164 RepID=UPI003F5DACA3
MKDPPQSAQNVDDVEAYATLAAQLADPSADRAALLAAHGLDEAGWEALDDAWQARLSEADDDDGEEVGVPPLVVAYAETFARVQRARAKSELSFERFLEAARGLKRGTDMATVLSRLDLTLEDYLSAQQRWTAAMLEDEALMARFQRAMR